MLASINTCSTIGSVSKDRLVLTPVFGIVEPVLGEIGVEERALDVAGRVIGQSKV